MTVSVVVRRAAAIVGAVALVSGCSWRLETPEPDWPSPDATTLERDAAADREQAVIDAVATASDSTDDAVLATLETTDAPMRLEQFGGVYVAYPSASPSPAPEPSAVPVSVRRSVLAAQEGHFATALDTTDGNLALLTASAGLSHALSVWYADWVADVVVGDGDPVSADRLLASDVLNGETLVPASTTIDVATVSALALAHDRAGYLYEVLAARAEEEEREQWLARRDLQRERAEALLALPGTVDERESTYVTPTRELPDAEARVSAAQSEELAIAETYASLLDGAEASDLPWLLSGAFDAYAQAGAYGDPTVAVASIPALPGVETP